MVGFARDAEFATRPWVRGRIDPDRLMGSNVRDPAALAEAFVEQMAPALRVVGTLEQSEVDEDFTALVPVEIQIARGRTITHWVQSSSAPVSFTVSVSAAPSKVLLDPKRAILRR